MGVEGPMCTGVHTYGDQRFISLVSFSLLQTLCTLFLDTRSLTEPGTYLEIT